MLAMQKRMSLTTRMIASLKSLKVLGTESRVADQVQDLRVNEIEVSKVFRNLLVIIVLFCKSSK
jgi:ATP-binding cassette, subfamily C (CFTR/MRP), member 1